MIGERHDAFDSVFCFFRLACRSRRCMNTVFFAIADLFAHGDWVTKLVKCMAPSTIPKFFFSLL